MPKNQMTKILENPLKHESMARGYGGILAGLFARIIYEMNISVPRWLSLMDAFVTDARNGAQTENQKDRTSMRGNLTKEFSRDQMTWKVFIKGLRFLQIVRFQLTITAYHANGKVTRHHSKPINLGGRSELQEFLRNVDTPDDAELAEYQEAAEEVINNAKTRPREKRWAAEQLSKIEEQKSPESKWAEARGDAVAAGQAELFEEPQDNKEPK